MKKKFETRVIHEGQVPEKEFGSVSKPIYQTSTFKQGDFASVCLKYISEREIFDFNNLNFKG